MTTEPIFQTKPQDVLIEEYKICDLTVSRLDSLIWQMASILFPITLAGLAYFGVNPSHTTSELFTLVTIAIGSSILLLNWWLLSRHWASYQKVTIYRMREIELEIGAWLYRYTNFVRLEKKDRDYRIKITTNIEEQNRLKKLNDFFGKFPYFGLFRSMRIVTIYLLLVGLH